MTLQEWTTRAAKTLEPVYLGNCEEHARLLASEALEMEFSKTFQKRELSSTQLFNLHHWLNQRVSGIPLQHLSGRSYFWKETYQVGPGVFIPRSETEILVDTFLKHQNPSSTMRVGELGGGCGNIGLSIIQTANVEWHTFERDEKALPYLRENAKTYGKKGYSIHPEDFFEKALRFGPYDWIVSNPPYLSSTEIALCTADVQKDPRLALDGGATGFAILERLIGVTPTLLKKDGRLLLEIGNEQWIRIKNLCENAGLSRCLQLEDLQGKARGIFAHRA